MLKLFYARGTIALATHIALEEAGADYEAVALDFNAAQQRGDEYLAINPKGRVPALVTDRGVLTETPATLAYIAQTHKDANLAPLDDPFAFAQVQAFNSYLCSTVHVCHAHKRRGSRWVDDEAAIEAMQAKVPQTMSECCALIEAEMFAGPWVMGDAYTVCDPYLFTIATWLEGDGVDVGRFPVIADFRERMKLRAAVKSAMAQQESAPSR